MALFSYKCPSCNKITLIDPNGKCLNTLRNGQTCGYQLPFTYQLANRKLREKWDKHTAPPGQNQVGTYSWVDDPQDYGLFHHSVLSEGTASLDPQMNYLFLWHTPQGTSSIANVMYGTAGTASQASGVIAPLNSKLQNIHSFYGNWENHWVCIDSGSNLIIEEPNDSHPDLYQVKKNKSIIFEFNPNTKNFVE